MESSEYDEGGCKVKLASQGTAAQFFAFDYRPFLRTSISFSSSWEKTTIVICGWCANGRAAPSAASALMAS